MNRKSRPRPDSETSSTGRRPRRSASSPRIGPAKKLITPPQLAKTTFHSAAAAVSPPTNCFSRLGRIGTMMPIDMALVTALMKMKPNAARGERPADALSPTDSVSGRNIHPFLNLEPGFYFPILARRPILRSKHFTWSSGHGHGRSGHPARAPGGARHDGGGIGKREMFDTVIRNGTLVDGTGAPARR